MAIRANIPIKLYFLLVLMLIVILIAGIYGIRELNALNQITATIYADHIRISEKQFRISEEVYHIAKRNTYIFLLLSLTFFILLGGYVIKNVRHLIKNLKLTNDKIIQSEGKFQELMKYAGDSIFMIDASYQITAMNDSASKLLNYSREEFQNMKIYELMTEDDQKTFASRIKIINTEGGSLHERKLIRKNGSFVETEVNVRPIEGLGYIAVFRDITERKEIEIKIRENEERYKSIISVSNTGAWEYHSDSEFVWCSPEYFLMLGRKQSDYDMSGTKNLKEVWTDLLHPEDRERAVNYFAEYLQNGSVGMYESYFRMRHVNSSWVWIWSRGKTLRDAQGKLTNLTVGTHIDMTERKQIEKNLIESEIRFREVLENSISASYKRNLQTNSYEYLSPVFNKIVNYTQEELNSLPLETVIGLMHPDDVESVKNGITKAITELNGLANSVEYRFKHKTNGEYRWLKDEFIVMQDEQGQPVSLIGSVSDITERKRIERELIESKEQLALFIEHSPASLAMFDTEMRYIATSRRWMNDYNLRNQNIIGRTHYEVFPEITQNWKDIHQRCLKGAIERNEEDSFERLDGSKEWIRWEIRPWHKSNREIGGIIMFTEVITERKESELLFKNLVEKSLVGVYIVQKGRFVYANPKFAHYLGYTQEELLSIDDFLQIVDESYTPVELEQWRKKVDAGIIDDFHIELKYKRKDGEVIWSDVYCGETIYKGAKAILGSFQDITERKLMESERQKILEEMLQRNRDLEQFAYIVSHNLRAPVANIIGISEYILNPEIEADEKEEMNNGLIKSVHRLDEVIKDLNNILQKKREISEKKEIVNFSNLLDNIKISIGNLIKKEEVIFIADFTAVDKIMTIKSYLHSIFYNLISNSIKYRHPDITPVIEIKSTIVDNKIEINYRDNGLGIDLEKRGEQVFGLYKKFHTHIEGKGMGLYMVKTQVETLGGSISIKSEVNKGTEFNIKFEIEKNST